MMNIFDSEELEMKEALEKAKIAINQKFGIIRHHYEKNIGSDYPKIKILHAETSKQRFFSDGPFADFTGSGVSMNPDMALLKSLSEAFERYAATIYKKQNFIKSSFSTLKERALNPCEVVSFSKKQLKKKDFEGFRFDENSQFHWIEGISLISNEKILVPAQLVYWNYMDNAEPTIQFGLSTGVAGGTSYAASTLRGILETVERDAFIIAWLNKLPLREIDFSESKDLELQRITHELIKYKFELRVFDATTDVKIHSFIAILIDNTSTSINCGLKAGLDPEQTVRGVIEEAFHAMAWRKELAKKFPNKKINPESIISFEDRAIYWNQKRMIKELNFLLRNKQNIKISELQNYSSGSCLRDLSFIIQDLKEKNLETIVVDITPRDVEQIGFKEVKVLIPKMQPLFFREKYKYLGGTRLYEVPKLLRYKPKKEEELNKTPHPFL